MSRRPHHYGFKTRDKAEDALESDFAFGRISECEKPRIEAYTVTRAGKPERRYMITCRGIHAMPITITHTWGHLGRKPGRPPTIWQALTTKLGREPTHAEACAEVKRILTESNLERKG